MALQLPRGAAREYLALYGITAVYVAEVRSGPMLVGSTRDLLRSLNDHRRHFAAMEMICVYWLPDEAQANLIVREVNARMPPDATAQAVQRVIENVAALRGLRLTEHATVLLRASAAVSHIEEKIEQACADGGLRWFNREFRAWRLKAKLYGRSASYAVARARLRRLLFRDILSGQFHGVRYSLKREIFPNLDEY